MKNLWPCPASTRQGATHFLSAPPVDVLKLKVIHDLLETVAINYREYCFLRFIGLLVSFVPQSHYHATFTAVPVEPVLSWLFDIFALGYWGYPGLSWLLTLLLSLVIFVKVGVP